MAVIPSKHSRYHEIIFAEHAPRDSGLITLWLERKFGRVGGFEGLEEFEFDADEFRGLALHERHAAFADFVVARPEELRADRAWRAGEFVLAEKCFDRSAAIDRPAAIFRERARDLATQSFATDWEPIRTLQEK